MRDTENEVETLRDDIGALEARTGKFVEKVKEWQVYMHLLQILT